MDKFSFIVLGAGPSGLAYARARQLMGDDEFILLESERDPGGLCRSKATPWGMADMGGGHMWCTRHEDAERFVMAHLSRDQWRSYDRDSTILIMGREIGYPIEEHLWQLSIDDGTRMIMDALHARASCAQPSNFEEWVVAKFGEAMARRYMLPYNRKLWGSPLSRLSLEWLHKLPSVRPEIIIRSLMRRGQDREALFHKRWWYPRRGGFQSMTDALAAPLRGKLVLGEPVVKIRTQGESIIVNDKYSSRSVINTMPWPLWGLMSDAPLDTKLLMRSLEAIPLAIDLVPPMGGNVPQWTYYPSELTRHHRRFFSHAWMPGAKFDFTETNLFRRRSMHGLDGMMTFENEWAYPAYTTSRAGAMAGITAWAKRVGVVPLGRWGEWDYANSDVCIHNAMEKAVSGSSLTSMDLGRMA